MANKVNNKSILPVALRDTEITVSDVAVILSVAKDKKAPAGRYKRTLKRLPTAESPVIQQ